MARMRDYIAGNPARWAEDTENPNHLKKKDDAVGALLAAHPSVRDGAHK